MNTRLDFNFPATTKLYFGTGKLSMLHTLEINGKALVVISNGKSTRKNGYLERTLKELSLAGVEAVVYDKVQPNPTKECIEEGAAVARENKCTFIVALGGGSVMDAAKVIALNATNTGDLWDYAMSGTGKRKPLYQKPLPWIAITTTAGTGSEVDAIGVITNLATKEKLGIASVCATHAIVDPELTLTVPPFFTALQGFDALFHVLEGHICKSSNLMSDMIQETAIRNIAQYLPVACKDGNNLEARTHVAFANTLGGYSMDCSTCTVEHSIEHALSAYHEQLPHGAGLIMLSKAYFTTIINQHVADERFINMARWMGNEGASKPEDFIDALTGLQQACGVADLRMSDYDITPNEFDDMADNAITIMARLSTQDIQPLTHDEIVSILKASYR